PQGITGPVMMEDLRAQAERFGTDVRFGYATKVDFSTDGGIHKVEIDGVKTVEAETVIIATGATAKWLGLDSEEKYNGFGVSACAVCDGFFYKGQDVAIVGAGDTAAEEATYLAKLCRNVYMLVSRHEFSPSTAILHLVVNTSMIQEFYYTSIIDILEGHS